MTGSEAIFKNRYYKSNPRLGQIEFGKNVEEMKQGRNLRQGFLGGIGNGELSAILNRKPTRLISLYISNPR